MLFFSGCCLLPQTDAEPKKNIDIQEATASVKKQTKASSEKQDKKDSGKEKTEKEEQEQTERKKQERIAQKQAEQEKIAQEQAEQEQAAQAEQQRITQEQAAQAEQQRIAQEQAAIQAAQTSNVWLSATGSKYHSIPNCGRMNPDNARQVTLAEAQQQGIQACQNCH